MDNVVTGRDLWKKRYFEEKKVTNPLDDQTNRLKMELESLQRKLMAQLEVQRERRDGRRVQEGKPSNQVSCGVLCSVQISWILHNCHITEAITSENNNSATQNVADQFKFLVLENVKRINQK